MFQEASNTVLSALYEAFWLLFSVRRPICDYVIHLTLTPSRPSPNHTSIHNVGAWMVGETEDLQVPYEICSHWLVSLQNHFTTLWKETGTT